MSLTSWDATSDYFNHSELAANWDAIDNHDHTTGKGVKIPAGGLADNAVAGAAIADASVTASKIAAASVGSSQIIDSSVGASKISSLPGTRVYNNAAISVADSTETLLTFNNERYDTTGLHDTSTNPGRIVASYAGVYLIVVNIEWAANATGTRSILIYLNGTTKIASQNQVNNGASIVTRQSVSTLYYLAPTDYVTVNAYQTSGGSLNVQSTGNYSPEFAAQWLSA